MSRNVYDGLVTRKVTIASGASLSGAVEPDQLGNLIGVIVPSTWTTNTNGTNYGLAFKGSVDANVSTYLVEFTYTASQSNPNDIIFNSQYGLKQSQITFSSGAVANVLNCTTSNGTGRMLVEMVSGTISTSNTATGDYNTAVTITVTTVTQADNYYDVYNESNAKLSYPVTASTYVNLPFGALAGVRFLKLVSVNSSGAALNQSTAQEFILVFRRYI